MDIEILDSCKENIQPLKKGRKANQLGLALQAEVNTELHEKLIKERGELELAIITYDGPDPLQPRIDYVNWMEQTHIKQGRDCNLVPLLEDTITLLKDNENYKQDPRFIELIVKYIELQENAIELFQMVYSQGLGTMCSVLYKAWAETLDQALDFKRADQVYQLGIANHAEPVDKLKEAHAQFQLSIGRRMMLSGGELPQVNSEDASTRQVLGKLKKDVGSIRTSHGAAGVLTIRQNKHSSNKNVPVFQDAENNYDHLITTAIQKNKLASIATAEKNNEENTIKPGSWNKGYNRREVARLAPVPSTPSFKVHVDPEAEIETPKVATKTPSNVLKTRKAELGSNAMEILSAAHSGRKALQSNLELYSGGREFSFEELRAAYYLKKSVEGEDFRTPMKKSHQSKSPESCNYEFQTPVQALSNLSLSCSNPTSRDTGVQQNPSDKKNNESSSFQTPLKRVGFMPLTPSIKDEIFEDLEATPVQNPQPPSSRRKPLSFSIFSEDSSASSERTITLATGRNDALPTIEENQELGDDSWELKKAPIRKKQLFSETPVNNPPVKSNNTFSIFVDED